MIEKKPRWERTGIQMFFPTELQTGFGAVCKIQIATDGFRIVKLKLCFITMPSGQTVLCGLFRRIPFSPGSNVFKRVASHETAGDITGAPPRQVPKNGVVFGGSKHPVCVERQTNYTNGMVVDGSAVTYMSSRQHFHPCSR